MKESNNYVKPIYQDLNQVELQSVSGGGLWDNFWKALGRSHGRQLCGNVPKADFDSAMKRWRRGSTY